MCTQQRDTCSSGSRLTSDHQVPLNGLHQRQRVDLHRAALPLLDVAAVRVPLQLTLELVRVEELERLRAPA